MRDLREVLHVVCQTISRVSIAWAMHSASGGTERGFLVLVHVRHLGLKHVQEVRVRIPHPTDSAMSGDSSVTVPGIALFLFLLIPHRCVPRTTLDSIGKTEPEVE